MISSSFLWDSFAILSNLNVSQKSSQYSVKSFFYEHCKESLKKILQELQQYIKISWVIFVLPCKYLKVSNRKLFQWVLRVFNQTFLWSHFYEFSDFQLKKKSILSCFLSGLPPWITQKVITKIFSSNSLNFWCIFLPCVLLVFNLSILQYILQKFIQQNLRNLSKFSYENS